MLKTKIKALKRVNSAWKIIRRHYQTDLIKAVSFFRLYVKCFKYTHASVEDLLHLYTFVEITKTENIEGDIVECGSWRGGSSAIMLYRERQIKNKSSIYIYDSFEGLPAPREVSIDGLKAQKVNTGELAWLKASKEDVETIMKKLHIYDDRVHIIKGWFDKTTLHTPVQKISILHSDGDLYESTKTVLENFYHKVVKNGFIVNNDYGDTWIGAKKAMDEFIAENCPDAKIILIPGGGAYFRKL
jgi:hypothetical protein